MVAIINIVKLIIPENNLQYHIKKMIISIRLLNENKQSRLFLNQYTSITNNDEFLLLINDLLVKKINKIQIKNLLLAGFSN